MTIPYKSFIQYVRDKWTNNITAIDFVDPFFVGKNALRASLMTDEVVFFLVKNLFYSYIPAEFSPRFVRVATVVVVSDASNPVEVRKEL